MKKYIIAVAVIGILIYGGWYLYQDTTTEEIESPVTTQEE
jgi:predicted negative regulator of RcsB-dependent stress response|tara:strand:- start:33 stop:152 length:120 start_codon:yes stop_codon:yes gene_type:complete